ncbi:MAG: dethiobiotin synthase [Sulfuriferula sp.]
MTARGYFVTGTDTGVGKTLITAALLRFFAQRGLRATGMKPVAAGCEWRDGVAYWDDVEQLRAAGNADAAQALVNPYHFEAAIAPHIAAAQAGMTIQLDVIARTCDALHAQADVVIVEGAGGFRVPLNDHQDMADLARKLSLPVILVVGMRLGCINHALLSAEAIRQTGLPLAGWVANRIDPAMAQFDASLATLQQRLNMPLLGVVPWLASMDFSALSTHLTFEKLI